jgi:hypothetical protein
MATAPPSPSSNNNKKKRYRRNIRNPNQSPSKDAPEEPGQSLSNDSEYQSNNEDILILAKSN